jgi:hypothetical protein
MRISLYLDEDSRSNSLVHSLLSRGVDVTTAREARMLGTTDLAQLVWATEHGGRVLYSFNIRDFFCLHTDFLAQGKSRAGYDTRAIAIVFDWRADASITQADRRQIGRRNDRSG